MPEVENPNYTGKDRRINGARLKLSARDWIYLGTICISLILFIGNIKWTTAALSKTTEEHDSQINTNVRNLAKVENDITNIKENLTYIRGKIDTLVLRVK